MGQDPIPEMGTSSYRPLVLHIIMILKFIIRHTILEWEYAPKQVQI